MQLIRLGTGQRMCFDLLPPLAEGGEARVYEVPGDPSLVAKLYRHPTDPRRRKLQAMLANPPDDPMRARGGMCIAWPVDLLVSADERRQVEGFVMPRVAGMRPIIDFYHPETRRQHCPLFDYQYLHRTARNLAAAMGAIHAQGYVIGDVNESNVLVSPMALAALIDTDSFQVRDPATGTTIRCPVGKSEYTPREIQGRTFAEVDRAVSADLFGLGVLIFQLLMEGTHPFDGVFLGDAEPPLHGERIARGHFPYAARRRVPYRPKPLAPPLEILHPQLRQLFLQCFEQGHDDPAARPDARTWREALDAAEQALVTCPANGQHRYGNHLASCPWCERKAKLGGRDPFPSPSAAHCSMRLVAPCGARPSSRRAAPRSAARSRRRDALGQHPGLATLVSVMVVLMSTALLSSGHRDSRATASTLANTARICQEQPEEALEAELALPADTAAALPAPLRIQTNSIGMQITLLPAGEFLMGARGAEGDADERPLHRVRITRPFWLSVCPVTVGQFRQFAAATEHADRGWQRAFAAQVDEQPVVNVSWNDAVAFVQWLSAKEGHPYRLPTEAEWEYACRAGTRTRYSFGDDPGELGAYGWHAGNAAGRTHPVGQKRPGGWGVHDMHGNVWQWCQDWYDERSYRDSPANDPQGPQAAACRVLRGGAWNHGPEALRSANRHHSHPDSRLPFCGFRVARTFQQE